MSNILFANLPAFGHVNPTLPVVSELVQRGHRVIYYNAATFEPVIADTGAAFRPYPESDPFQAELAARIHNLVDVTVLVLTKSRSLVPFLCAEIEREQPDAVVFDSIALWGMLAARRLGIPNAASITTYIHDGVPGLIRGRDYLHILRQSLSRLPAIRRLRRELEETYGRTVFPGKAILPTRGDLNLVYTSRDFQPDTPALDPSFRFVGPSILPSTRREAAFPWDALDCGRPRVYLSLGTLYNDQLDFYRAILRAFTAFPAQFILSAGRQIQLRDLEPVPPNFLVFPSVPQLDLLQEVDIFITHGGMNSVNESLYYGVPMVVVPQQLEQVFNGRQVTRLGAGLVLGDSPPYGRISPEALKTTLQQVLAAPVYRQNAARLSRAFQATGGYHQAASDILSLRPEA